MYLVYDRPDVDTEQRVCAQVAHLDDLSPLARVDVCDLFTVPYVYEQGAQ